MQGRGIKGFYEGGKEFIHRGGAEKIEKYELMA
jgi:hypothetical protein